MYYRKGIIALARSRDDAAPEWRWFWDRLAIAWVPKFDPWIAVTPVGPSVVSYGNTDNRIRPIGGGEGSCWMVKGQASAEILTKQAELNAGFTLMCSSRIESRGNQYSALAGITSQSGAYNYAATISNVSGEQRRDLVPPGAYDSVGIYAGLNVDSVNISTMASGDQRHYVDRVAGTSYSNGMTPDFINPTYWYCGSYNGAMEMYQHIFLSGVLIGPTAARDIPLLDEIARTLAPFRWQRRRAYSFATAGPPPSFTPRGLWFTR